MNFKRKSFPLSLRIRTGLSILFLLLAFGTFGQTTGISGIINTVSARIEAVYGAADTDVDSIKVNNTTGFNAGDTVMIYMSVGASITTVSGTNEGKMGAKRNSGKYAIFIIQSIDIPGKYIILNSTLPDFVPLVPGEFGQVVKVPTYRRAVITNTLTCNPYDTASKTGGILVLLVKESLNFNADINVDGKGFPGASPDAANYTGTCSTSDPVNYLKAYFTSAESNFSALKGYGVTYTHNSFVRGNGANINGGGGGNGKFSGGGGGANGGDGGSGGNEYAGCAVSTGMGGKGGRALSLFYDNIENRVGFGGGGGTSSQILPDFKATKGGNGGGIVIIVCDSLIGNKNIYARGESVTELSTAGAGGGGGGGTIILHVNTYLNSPKLWVTGGNGGSVSSLAPLACGPGGGGGGGVIWHNGATLGGPTPNLAFGINGTYNSGSYGSTSGSLKPKITNLIIPIRGFIFNYIPNADTICFGDAPRTINSARPVGGTSVFFYNWLESTDSLTWTDAAGKRDTVNYTPPPSTNITKYYRRAVYNPPVLRDTSNVVKMYVMPVISNNSIKPDTTVCANLNAGTLYPGLQITGGNNKYRYKWEKSPDGTFTPADSVGASANFTTPIFTTSTWYRRVATSGPVKTACKSTSNAVKITVLPVITNNIQGVNQEICITRTPALLTGNAPAGGAGAGSYTYKWQKKTTGLWSDEVTTASYQPPSLSLNHDYRRIVYSGPASTCKDTSAVLSVTVMPDITNNTIGAVTQDTLCSGLPGEILTGSDPQNGNLTYSYYWQKGSTNSSGGLVKTNFNPGVLTATSTFRRVVTSGTNPDSLQRCISISNQRTIVVLQNIANNTLSTPKTIWCQGKTPDAINGQLPLNGSGAYAYSWQSRLPAGSWVNRPEITRNFTVPVITSSVDYRRIVKSGLNTTCKDTSNVISLIMQDSILNNRINENLTVFVCFDENSTIQATLSGPLFGGSGIYSYLWRQSSTINGTYTDASQISKMDSLYLTEPIQTARYYKRKVSSGDCENTSLPVLIDPLPLPELTALSAGLSEVCFNQMYSLINVSAQSGTLPYVFTFSDDRGFTDNRSLTASTQAIRPQVGNNQVSPFYFDYNYKAVSLVDAKGCFATASNLSLFSAPLRVYTTPVPSRISDLLEETCSPTLEVAVNPSFGVSSWQLSDVNGITADNTTNPDINLTANFTGRDSASVSLTYVETIANCTSDAIEVDAILYQEPDAITNIYRTVSNVDYLIGSDTLFIFISDNHDLKAAPVVSGVPGWSITSGSGTLSSATGITTKIDKLEQDNPAFLKYSISNGVCPVNERIIKIVRKELLVYDGFSPNGDDVNDDLWAVGLADEEVDFKFQLFSSSGNFFHEITRKDLKEIDLANNQVVLWDGTTNLGGDGNYVPDGTYYYVLMVKYHGEDFNKKGYIVVKR